MVEYLKFSNQMRPLSEEILNSLKIKEGQLNKRFNTATTAATSEEGKQTLNIGEIQPGFLELHDVWFQLVQLLISAAQGLEMEDQTIQQALILLKHVTLQRMARSVSPESNNQEEQMTLLEQTSNGLVCLMLASKVQDSGIHLKVANVVQLLRKFIDDNRGLSNSDQQQRIADSQFSSLRLQNRALLEQIASLEKITIQQLNFNLNVPTPAEFIVVYLQMFETKVTEIDWETIMMLRGQSLSNSYICLHVVQCVALGTQAIALASILNVMIDWQWNEVADSFIELMQTEAPDACSLDDVILCQHRLQEIIIRESQHQQQLEQQQDATAVSATELDDENPHMLHQSKRENKHLLLVDAVAHHHDTAEDLLPIAQQVQPDNPSYECHLYDERNGQSSYGADNPTAADVEQLAFYCNVHGENYEQQPQLEHHHADDQDDHWYDEQDFTDLANMAIKQVQHREVTQVKAVVADDNQDYEDEALMQEDIVDVEDVEDVDFGGVGGVGTYQIPETLTHESNSEVQMLNVVDERTTETDLADISDDDNTTHCEVFDDCNEQKIGEVLEIARGQRLSCTIGRQILSEEQKNSNKQIIDDATPPIRLEFESNNFLSQKQFKIGNSNTNTDDSADDLADVEEHEAQQPSNMYQMNSCNLATAQQEVSFPISGSTPAIARNSSSKAHSSNFMKCSSNGGGVVNSNCSQARNNCLSRVQLDDNQSGMMNGATAAHVGGEIAIECAPSLPCRQSIANNNLNRMGEPFRRTPLSFQLPMKKQSTHLQSELKIENPARRNKVDDRIIEMAKNERPKVGASTFVMNSKTKVNKNGINENKPAVNEGEFVHISPLRNADCDFISCGSSPLKMGNKLMRYTMDGVSFLSLKRQLMVLQNAPEDLYNCNITSEEPIVVETKLLPVRRNTTTTSGKENNKNVNGSNHSNSQLGSLANGIGRHAGANGESSPLSQQLIQLSKCDSRESGQLLLRTKICKLRSESFLSSMVSSGTMQHIQIAPYASSIIRKPCQPRISATKSQKRRDHHYSQSTNSPSYSVKRLEMQLQQRAKAVASPLLSSLHSQKATNSQHAVDKKVISLPLIRLIQTDTYQHGEDYGREGTEQHYMDAGQGLYTMNDCGDDVCCDSDLKAARMSFLKDFKETRTFKHSKNKSASLSFSISAKQDQYRNFKIKANDNQKDLKTELNQKYFHHHKQLINTEEQKTTETMINHYNSANQRLKHQGQKSQQWQQQQQQQRVRPILHHPTKIATSISTTPRAGDNSNHHNSGNVTGRKNKRGLQLLQQDGIITGTAALQQQMQSTPFGELSTNNTGRNNTTATTKARHQSIKSPSTSSKQQRGKLSTPKLSSDHGTNNTSMASMTIGNQQNHQNNNSHHQVTVSKRKKVAALRQI